MKPTTLFFAEVIESSVAQFTAQSWTWNQVPEYGSLVEIENNNTLIVGIVTNVTTGSHDPVRKPYTYQKTHAELLRDQPQIFAFLKTSFTVQIIGYYEAQQPNFLYLLPTQPVQLHTFVKNCTAEQYKKILENPLYLSILFAFQATINQLDELLLALLKKQSEQTTLSQATLQNFCHAFSLHTNNDYKRLKLFLQRSHNFLPQHYSN
jgi:hypothetical protein